MKRQKKAVVPAIPPYLDQFGKPCWNNPFGRYRPNPALNGGTQPEPVVQPTFANGATRVAQSAAVVESVASAGPVIAQIADEAPEVSAENTTAVIPVPSTNRLHLSVQTTRSIDAIGDAPLAFDT